MRLGDWLTWLMQSGGANPRSQRKQRFRPLIQELDTRLLLSANPVYTALTGASNPFNGIDVGVYSTPKLVDLDGDGDLDLAVAASDNTLRDSKNTGTTTSPTYVAQTGTNNPFNGLSFGTYCTPAFGDLDGDGDIDLVAGEQNGQFRYFKNTGTATSPTFTAQTGTNNPFNGFDVGNFSTPELGDIDSDGDLDLVSGDTIGQLRYFKNTGTATSPTFASQTGTNNPFNGFDVGAAGSVPTLGDVDGDGDLDLVVGGDDGTQHYFKCTAAGTSPTFVAQTGSANPFNGIDVGTFSAPGLGDLDGDGDLDLVSGDSSGTLSYFRADPGLASSVTSLNLGTTTVGTAGTAGTFTVGGRALVANIAIAAPTGVELSTDGGTTWQTSLTLTPSSGTVADTTISARITAGASLGSVSGNISISSTSATTQNVAVTGTVNSATSLTTSVNSLNLGTTVVGTAGTIQTFNVSGSGLVANVAIAAPTGVELSSNGGTTWQTSLTLTPSAGIVTSTTISARITAGASLGSVSGNITVSSTSATTQNVAVTGTVNASVSVTVSPSTVNESSGILTYTFTRTGATSASLTVPFSVGGNATFSTDYTQSGADTFNATLGSITFGIGASTVSFTLTSSPDGTTEGNETAIITVLSGTGYVVDSTNGSATGTIDDTGPTATFGLPSATLTASGNVTLSLTVSDTNFDASSLTLGDLSLIATGTASGTIGLSGSGSNYTITVSSITGSGTLAVRLANQSISDLVSNPNTSVLTSSTFTVDNAAPTATALLASNLTISPNNATSLGVKDDTTFTSTISDANTVSWTLTITNSSSATVRTFTGTGTAVSQLWDGKDSTSAFVSDGTYTATLTYLDAAGNVGVARTVNVVVDNSSPMLAPITTTAWTKGKSGFTGTMAITSGLSPYTIVSSTNVPTGLVAAISGSSVLFTGTPRVVGTFSGSLTVKDEGGNTFTRSFTIVIHQPLVFSALQLPSYKTGLSYYQSLKAIAGVTGGAGPLTYTFTITSGTLPTGLTLNTTTGVISGKPSTTRNVTIKVTVRDTIGSVAEKWFTLVGGSRYRF